LSVIRSVARTSAQAGVRRALPNRIRGVASVTSLILEKIYDSLL
jgi:hypothetical protein